MNHNPSTMSTDYSQETSACKQAYVSFQNNAGVPLCERFRPTKLEDVVLDPLNKVIMQNIIDDSYFPHLLFYGPPGTGKTMLARSIGRIVELPVVEFRISSLMNSYLGMTERRFAQAFATLEAMAPNVVFIDEIEKAFASAASRSTDGGLSQRMFGSLLT